jgi:adenylyltransferase/sulfurtransferase
MPETDQPSALDQDPVLARYSRQILFKPIGQEGQRRLLDSRVAVIGCGALGTVAANILARAGVGFLRICDRDFIEENNLQRQVLFDEDDLKAELPKAEAAKRKLNKINSGVEVESVVADVNHTNIEKLVEDVDLIVDGADNFEVRFLINDVSIKHEIPWIYGACISSTGLVMPIVPGRTPCLRCVFESPPPPGTTPTCDTAGVLASAVNVVASFQAAEAMKILCGRLDDINEELISVDVWSGHFQNLDVTAARQEANCPCCKRGEFEFLSGERASKTTSLCGRDAVQVAPSKSGKIDFDEVVRRVGRVARPKYNKFLLRFEVDKLSVTVFADGRAIIKGTDQPDAAKAIYAKYVGH